jgi:hydrogenase nickel incorporation protein HypA/HybF
MHEMSLMNDLMAKIQDVARSEGASRVSGVRVTLGAYAHISAEHFREHFKQGARGTLAEGARLDVRESDDTKDPRAQEIVLESIDVE